MKIRRFFGGFCAAAGLCPLLLSSACSRTEKPKGILPSAEAVAVHASPPTPSAAPLANPSATGAATPEPAPSALPPIHAEVAADPLATHIVYSEQHKTAVCDFRVHGLQNALLITACGDVAKLEGDQRVPIEVPMSNDSFITNLRLLRGTWPDGLSGIAEVAERNEGARGVFYDRYECLVTGNASGLHCSSDLALPVAWSKGRALTLRSGQISVLVGNRDLPLPQVALGAGTGCAERFHPAAIDALPDGRMIAAGPSCDHRGQLEVETWEGPGEGTVYPLPGSDELAEPVGLRVFLGRRGVAYVLARSNKTAALYRAEGSNYRRLSLPTLPDLWSALVRADGTFWIVGDGEHPIAYRLTDHTWSALGLPDEASVRHALGDPDIKEALRLQVTSIGLQKGETVFGALVVQGQDRELGGAVLKLGASPASAGPIGTQPDSGKN